MFKLPGPETLLGICNPDAAVADTATAPPRTKGAAILLLVPLETLIAKLPMLLLIVSVLPALAIKNELAFVKERLATDTLVSKVTVR